MDIRCADDLHDSFCNYQTLLIQQFDQMADEFGFITIDATRSVEQVFQDLRTHIQAVEGLETPAEDR
jgi:dTMP kinase